MKRFPEACLLNEPGRAFPATRMPDGYRTMEVPVLIRTNGETKWDFQDSNGSNRGVRAVDSGSQNYGNEYRDRNLTGHGDQ
jgi:hypothetical protein